MKNPFGEIELPKESSSGPVDVAELEQRIATLELARENEGLNHEAQVRELIKREIKQRIFIRWTALAVAMTAVVYMAILLICASHWYFWGKFISVPRSVAVTMFLAPIVSITTITVMLAVGAFNRKGEEMNGTPVGNLVAEGARALNGS